MLTFVDSLGVERAYGNIQVFAPKKAWPVYGDVPSAPMISRSLWPDLIARMGGDSDKNGVGALDSPFLPPVHDQANVGQCNADAAAALVEFQRKIQGLPHVQLSAADLYDRINGGVDQGSMLEDALEELLARGIGTAATCGTIWRRGMKTADAEERSRFKMLEAFVCPTFDHVMSAVLSGFGIVSGIMWYDNYEPDQSGWLTERGSGGGGGHAVFGYAPMMRQGGTKYGIAHLNSWTIRWGIQGRCVFPEAAYRGPVGGWYAARSVTTEDGGVPAPKM